MTDNKEKEDKLVAAIEGNRNEPDKIDRKIIFYSLVSILNAALFLKR